MNPVTLTHAEIREILLPSGLESDSIDTTVRSDPGHTCLGIHGDISDYTEFLYCALSWCKKNDDTEREMALLVPHMRRTIEGYTFFWPMIVVED